MSNANPDTFLVGISGAPGSGKDTTANYLKLLLDRIDAQRVAHRKLAHPLQDVVAGIGGFYAPDLSHRKLFDDRQWKESAAINVNYRQEDGYLAMHSATPRGWQQKIGNLYREIFGEDFWLERLTDSASGDKITLVSDVRYPNEADAMDYRIWISCPRLERRWEDPEPWEETHPSESHYGYLREQADIVIQNDPESVPLEEFHRRIYGALDEILFQHFPDLHASFPPFNGWCDPGLTEG